MGALSLEVKWLRNEEVLRIVKGDVGNWRSENVKRLSDDEWWRVESEEKERLEMAVHHIMMRMNRFRPKTKTTDITMV